jgi:hypothetical protein
MTRDQLAAVQTTLAKRFGGVTAYLRVPASGLWTRASGDMSEDEIVTVEVQVETIDRDWWDAYRRQLERDVHQDSILVRAIAVDAL